MISIVKVGTNYHNSNRKEFMIDSAADIADLPTTTGPDSCSPSSIAFTADLSRIYILGNDGEWHKAEV